MSLRDISFALRPRRRVGGRIIKGSKKRRWHCKRWGQTLTRRTSLEAEQVEAGASPRVAAFLEGLARRIARSKIK
jgi:hypothetical protein